MHQNDKIVLAAGIVIVAVGIRSCIKENKKHRKIREGINADTKAEIRRIKRAAAVVCDRIDTGAYRSKSIDDIMVDFEFERIITE